MSKNKINDNMKKALTILIAAMATTAYGQITTTKVAPKVELDSIPYDSTKNFLGKDVYKYIGQELYVKGMAKSLRGYGYSNFLIDYNKEYYHKNNIYKCCEGDGSSSKYNELSDKYFTVLEIIKHPKAKENDLNEYLYGNMSYLKLKEKRSNDIVYFKYDSQFEHSFPFLVVGFFEKQKNLVVGKEFVFADEVLESSTDIQTGKVVTTKTGQKWKCTELTIEEKDYTLSLVIENSLGEKTTISHERVFGEWNYGRAYTTTEADNYRKKFGQENFNRILQGKVKIGMTREMCKLSWGKPKSINKTITAGKKSEQWVYSDSYLYFDNGILTAIQ